MKASLEEYRVEQLSPIETQRANKFYRNFKFRNRVKAHDLAMVVKNTQSEIIACGFIRDYQAFRLLSGVAVATPLQSRGVGRLLLNHLSNHFETKTFTFPYQHLTEYYQQFGFKLLTEPSQIGMVNNLYQRYLSQGRKILLMRYSQS